MFSRLAGVSAGFWARPPVPATSASAATGINAAGSRRPLMGTSEGQGRGDRAGPSLAQRQRDPGGEEAVAVRPPARLLAGGRAALVLGQVRVLRLVADAVAVVVELLVLGRQLLGGGV